MAQRLEFDILAKDNASSGFVKAGRAASAASDDVLGLAKRLDEISRKSATARVGLAGDKEALAGLDKLDLKLLSTGRRVVDPKISLEGAAKASAEISALDVQLDKLSMKAGEAGATGAVGGGGLAGPAGMGALIAAGAALSPVLVTVGFGVAGFGAAAAGTLSPIMKAAQATGGLAANLKKLNPAQQDAALGLLGLEGAYKNFQAELAPTVLDDFRKALGLASHVMQDLRPVSMATGKALGAVLGQIDDEFQSGTWQSFFGFMGRTAGPDIALVGKNFTDLLHVLPPLLEDLQPVATGFLKVTDGVVNLSGALITASEKEHQLADAAGSSTGFLGHLAHAAAQAAGQMVPGAGAAGRLGGLLKEMGSNASGPASKGLHDVTNAAKPAATQVNLLNSALTTLNGLLSNQSAQVAWKQAQQAATKAIDAGSRALDGNSAKNLANRQLVITSTQRAVEFAQAQEKTGHDVTGASRTLSDQIRFLQRSGDKSAWVRGQLKLLEAALRALKSRSLDIVIHGDGTFKVGTTGLTGNARGGLITAGTTATADDVVVRVSKHETIVPAYLTPAVAPLMKAHGVPGFAGGVVGKYSGAVAGLGPWASRDVDAFTRSLESAVASGFKRAAQSFGGAGPGGGAPSANAALARRMFPGENFAAWNYVAMRESGWNQFARNPSSGAYGIPQALPPTKLPFAGQAAGGSNPAAQITWMEGYMRGRYGGAAGAAAHERAFNWYGDGLHATVSSPTLIGVGERGAERVDVTPVGQGRGAPLVEINGLVVRDEADLSILSMKLGFAISAAGLG